MTTTILVQNRKTLETSRLTLAMNAETPMVVISDYVARNYPHLHIVSRA